MNLAKYSISWIKISCFHQNPPDEKSPSEGVIGEIWLWKRKQNGWKFEKKRKCFFLSTESAEHREKIILKYLWFINKNYAFCLKLFCSASLEGSQERIKKKLPALSSMIMWKKLYAIFQLSSKLVRFYELKITNRNQTLCLSLYKFLLNQKDSICKYFLKPLKFLKFK